MGAIVWLASYPKSGNTWLRAFLANLIADRPEPVPLNELARYCEDEARPEFYSAAAGRPSTTLSLDELCALRRTVHQRIAARTRGTVLVKTHNFAGACSGYPLQDMQVTAGAVYVVRNPLDVAVSMTHHFGLTLDEAIDRLGDDRVATQNDELYVSQVLGSWSTHVHSWCQLEGERVIVLRYEDLLRSPARHFARVARLLGLGGSRERIERAVRHASFDRLASLERTTGFIEAPSGGAAFFRHGKANQWRGVLSAAQAARVVDVHGDLMRRFGYLPAGR